MFAITATLIFIQPIVALSAFLLFGSLYGGVVLLTKKKLNNDSERISYEQDQVIKILQEGFGSIRDILVSNTQEVYLRTYSLSFHALQKAWSNVEIIKGSPRYIIEALGVISIALLALFFSSEPGGVVGALPILGAMALGAQRLLPALQQLYSSWAGLRGYNAAMKEVLEMLGPPPALARGPPSRCPASPRGPACPSLPWWRRGRRHAVGASRTRAAVAQAAGARLRMKIP